MARHLHDRIERVAQHVARAVFVDALLRSAAWLTLGLAAAVLAMRVAAEWDRARAAWLFAPIVLAPVLAWRIARRKRWSTAAAATWLDWRSGASGALVTGFERDDPAWNGHVDAALARADLLPRARWGRPAALLLFAIAFAALATWVTIPRVVPGPSRAVQTAAIERVEEKLATLEEQVTLDPVVAEELHESLERLENGTDGESIEGTFEALDRAGERLEDEARARAEAAESALESLAAAESAASGDPEAAQKQLEATLEALAKSGLAKGLEGALPEELGAKGLELPAGTKLDAAQIAKLTAGLESKLGEKLAKLSAAGLLKEGRFAKGEKPGEISEHVCDASCARNPGGT